MKLHFSCTARRLLALPSEQIYFDLWYFRSSASTSPSHEMEEEGCSNLYSACLWRTEQTNSVTVLPLLGKDKGKYGVGGLGGSSGALPCLTVF